jgi:conjugal transfer pilus assembly protein TraB
LVNKEGKIIEKGKVEGWVMGEDGRSGIKGMVVDKSSDVARMAILSGILSGLSQFMQNQAMNGKVLALPIGGSSNGKNLGAQDALKVGTFTGGSNAFDKLADYAIKRAEQMSPVIVIGSGRVVDIVFKKGFGLKSDNDGEIGSVKKSGMEPMDNQPEWQEISNLGAKNKLQQKFLNEEELQAQQLPVKPYQGGM